MRHLLAGVLTLALLCPLAFGEGLKVTGDVVTVVKGFPVTVTAPLFTVPDGDGAVSYKWRLPDAVKASRGANVLTVSAAPKGQHKVTVDVTVVNFTQKVYKELTYETVLTVGDVPGPTPPPVPPPPVDPLVKELKAAYDADTGTDKAEHLAGYAAFYGEAAKFDMGSVETVGALYAWLLEARRKVVPDGKIDKVRDILNGQIVALVGKKTDDKLTGEHRQRLKALFGRFADALKEVAK